MFFGVEAATCLEYGTGRQCQTGANGRESLMICLEGLIPACASLNMVASIPLIKLTSLPLGSTGAIWGA